MTKWMPIEKLEVFRTSISVAPLWDLIYKSLIGVSEKPVVTAKYSELTNKIPLICV